MKKKFCKKNIWKRVWQNFLKKIIWQNFLKKICTAEYSFKNFGRKFLSKMWIFHHNFVFWPKFRFLAIISIFDQNFDFWPEFRFFDQHFDVWLWSGYWAKISLFPKVWIFSSNFDCWPKFNIWVKCWPKNFWPKKS